MAIISPSTLDRRRFLQLLGAAAGATALHGYAATLSPSKPENFTFLFMTDTHTQPELDAAHGTDMAFRHARTFPADFTIQGGDHIFDALGVPAMRVLPLFDLYAKTEQDLGMKLYHTLGNHDCFGIYTKSGVSPIDPHYGKKLFQQRFGSTYYSFDHKGYHFVILDSIGFTERRYCAEINLQQLQWLVKDLAAQPAGAPIIVVTHIPLTHSATQAALDFTSPHSGDGPGFTNGPETMRLLEKYNVIGVLQGHVHINKEVKFNGIRYLTCGAVCGNWWHGPMHDTPEGFTVVTVTDGQLNLHYETYGFRTIAPEAS
jgi:3',5'-cyclic AMP phosphodiesterase CpdA